MMWQWIYGLLMLAGTLISLIYFRDLGDITQAFIGVKRKNMIFAIRHEYKLILVSAACASNVAPV
jgi:hypothetical protein